ncbi:hypothetical protein B0H19DRAFT_1262246 [Mycena capillaripes]|nr:hypothetical protein B0H19DRAFT_1262246 [Mycena capillaripes]
MFRFFVLLPILSVAAHTVNSRQLLVGRQTVADCTAPCDALSDSLSAGSAGGLAAICTNTVVNNYAACYNCETKISGMTQESAQQAVDAYVSSCKAGGHPVNGVTISADGGSSPAASGAAPAASGASGSSGSSGSSSTPAKTGGAVQTSAGFLGAASAFVFLAVGMVI